MKSSRRRFIQATAAVGTAAAVPAVLGGCSCPCRKTAKKDGLIHIGVIGLGRIADGFEIPNVLAQPKEAKIVAVCDWDKVRLDFMKARIDKSYGDSVCRAYSDFRKLLADPDVDAVMICTPDHWHAQAVVEAAVAGKDIWVQKPLAQTILESRIIANVVKEKGLVMQVGAQQRSWWQFHRACELVRNGRIGRITRVEVGLANDKPGGNPVEMPVPPTFNYDGWLGPVGDRKTNYYTETRVHPQSKDGVKPDYGRPGWITMEPFGWGMITNWGAHHLNIAQWGLGMDDSGPVEIEGSCEPLGPGLWNVHGRYDITYTYANGVKLHLASQYKNGIKFIGEKGWIFVTRAGAPATKNDPSGAAVKLDDKVLKDPTSPKDGISFGLQVSDPEILNVVYGADAVKLHVSPCPDKGECFRHVADWLKSIRDRSEPVAGAEVSHRSNIVCVQGVAAMKLKRKLIWDNAKELFVGDDEANARFNRHIYEAPGFSIPEVMKKAGLKMPS